MKLYVGNLSSDINDQKLKELFAPFGEPTSAQVVTDRDSGTSRGFGFVELGSAAEGNAAIAALNGKEHGGRALIVNEARPKRDRNSR
jgi:RNA recognition motif-containing protein